MSESLLFGTYSCIRKRWCRRFASPLPEISSCFDLFCMTFRFHKKCRIILQAVVGLLCLRTGFGCADAGEVQKHPPRRMELTKKSVQTAVIDKDTNE